MRALDSYGCVRLNALFFKPIGRGCLVIHFADIKYAAVGQCVPLANGENTTACLRSDDARPACRLKRGDKYLGRARSALAGKYDHWNARLFDRLGDERRLRTRFYGEGETQTIGKLAHVHTAGQKS